MSTYKTNAKEVFDAFAEHDARVQALRDKAAKFAKRFGADEQFVVRNSAVSGYSVVGFSFTPPKDAKVWTKPDREAFGAQRPRTGRPSGLTPTERDEWKALLADWNARYPSERVAWEPVLESLGLTPGDLFFSGPFALFRHDGWVYLKTEVKPRAAHMIEILNSEFAAAETAHKESQKEKL